MFSMLTSLWSWSHDHRWPHQHEGGIHKVCVLLGLKNHNLRMLAEQLGLSNHSEHIHSALTKDLQYFKHETYGGPACQVCFLAVHIWFQSRQFTTHRVLKLGLKCIHRQQEKEAICWNGLRKGCLLPKTSKKWDFMCTSWCKPCLWKYYVFICL